MSVEVEVIFPFSLCLQVQQRVRTCCPIAYTVFRKRIWWANYCRGGKKQYPALSAPMHSQL